MIDTDKYKGHTPAPWTLEKVEETYAQHEHYLLIGNDNLLSAIHHGGQEWDEHESNAQLIADAPLLLAILEQVQELAIEATHPDGKGGQGGDVMRKIARLLGVL